MTPLKRNSGRSFREKNRPLTGKPAKISPTFAQIVDYKSSFTSRHSIGVAEKAAAFAAYNGYDPTQVQKMYLAGALHDIGKMAIDNDILEKPDKLTDEEFSKMKTMQDILI